MLRHSLITLGSNRSSFCHASLSLSGNDYTLRGLGWSTHQARHSWWRSTCTSHVRMMTYIHATTQLGQSIIEVLFVEIILRQQLIIVKNAWHKYKNFSNQLHLLSELPFCGSMWITIICLLLAPGLLNIWSQPSTMSFNHISVRVGTINF